MAQVRAALKEVNQRNRDLGALQLQPGQVVGWRVMWLAEHLGELSCVKHLVSDGVGR